MQDKERLRHLWEGRDDLGEAEWAELYQIVFAILGRYSPSILRSLPESKEHYIQDFFLHKVFEPARRSSSSPLGPGELCGYFSNYLIDVYRSAGMKIEYSDDLSMYERNCEDPELPDEREFFEYGLNQQGVLEKAQLFLEELDEVGRIYLALYACSDAPEPLYKLAERFRIPSYHYRAHQLGITRKKGEFGRGYENTQIGQWLTKDLGLEITASPAVLSALKILCLVSLRNYQHTAEPA